MTSPANLPDDIDALKAIIVASQAKMVDQDGIIERKEDRIIRLEKLLADFKRALYGAKSEKGHPDQYHLALEISRWPWQLFTPKMKRLIHQRLRLRC